MTVKRKKTKPTPASYQKRTYRKLAELSGLTSFEVQVKETDLHIMADCNLAQEATDLIIQFRSQLENYIATHPAFLSSLTPLPDDKLAPPIIKAMLAAGQAAEVGPMAAVAGTIAEFVGKALHQKLTSEIIVENGGDIYLARNHDSVIGIFAGTSPLSNKVGIKIPRAAMPLGICTSSGTVGHSLSLGEADSVTVLAHDTALADTAATRLGNEVIAGQDINQALAIGQTIAGLIGMVIIRDDQLGAWGNVQLVPLPSQQ